MGIRFNSALSAVAATVAIATALPAPAQEEPDLRTIPAGFEDLFFNYSGTYFENRAIDRITGLYIGARFPEREIEWDSNAVHQAYLVHLGLQNRADPLIRVPDLPNPYTASLLTSPAYVNSATITGSEFIYEFTPMP